MEGKHKVFSCLYRYLMKGKHKLISYLYRYPMEGKHKIISCLYCYLMERNERDISYSDCYHGEKQEIISYPYRYLTEGNNKIISYLYRYLSKRNEKSFPIPIAILWRKRTKLSPRYHRFSQTTLLSDTVNKLILYYKLDNPMHKFAHCMQAFNTKYRTCIMHRLS